MASHGKQTKKKELIKANVDLDPTSNDANDAMSHIEQFALTEASYVIVRLLQRFDQIENREPETFVRHNQTLINCSGNGVKVRLHEAPRK